ncbi:MAG: ferritin family protein [Clostridiaceae bacterium]
MILICEICGMIIDENNLLVNNESFIEKNTLEKIIHCPFCGAPKEYLKKQGEHLICEDIKIEEDDKKIILKAMKLEIFNGDFYKEAALLAKDINVVKMFKALSRVEYTHANIHRKLVDLDILPKLSKPDYKKYNTDVLLIEQANIRERHAVKFYEKNTKNIKSSKLNIILKELANVEDEHVKLTL